MRFQQTSSAALCAVLLSFNIPVPAAVYKCIDADGTTTFSDRACEPKTVPGDSQPPAGTSGSGGSSGTTAGQRADSPKEKKAAHILDQLHIAAIEPENMLMTRTVDDAAPDLVKAIDPDNPSWTPANGRWYSISQFVKADLRRDVQTALRSSTAQVAQAAAREYAARTNDSDMDALSTYLNTPDGARYVAFQNEIRPLLYAALTSVLAQEPAPADTPTDKELRERRQLLSLTLEYRIAKDGGGPPSKELQPGSATVVENAARREGAALDTLYTEYETSLPAFQSFTDQATTRHFFTAVEPALRTELALSSTATTDFAEQEFDRYLPRWRAYYGPGVWVSSRNSVIILGRTVLVSHSTTTHYVNNPHSPSAELMALQCEQREGTLYSATHRAADYNARSSELKAIQNRCRAEQHLPPL